MCIYNLNDNKTQNDYFLIFCDLIPLIIAIYFVWTKNNAFFRNNFELNGLNKFEE